MLINDAVYVQKAKYCIYGLRFISIIKTSSVKSTISMIVQYQSKTSCLSVYRETKETFFKNIRVCHLDDFTSLMNKLLKYIQLIPLSHYRQRLQILLNNTYII